ncbi:gp43 [Burkholderia pseudomallei]|nr:gp43 [Burkholderia pseudomallei]
MTTTDNSRADALTERDYDLHEHEQGLYRKFDVRRVDGSSEPGGKHHDCEYFVLDMTHDQHARAALRAYADACASTHPELSADLIARYALVPIEQPAAAPINEDAEIPPIMYNGDTKRDPALRELLNRQVKRHVLSNPRGDAPTPSPADERTASWYCCDPVQICSAQCDSCAKQARAALKAIVDERTASFEAWCDRFPEISAVERLRDAWQEARAALPEDRIDWIANTHCPGGTAYPVNVKNAIREALREARISDNDTGAEAVAIPQSVINALRFYANGHHFNIDENHQQFDTVSGEPQNWLCSERDDDCTMIEDGSIAKAALCGGVLGFEESEKPIEGEVFTAAQQPAQADARVGLTAAARATIMDACRSISRGADGLKAGCAIGDEWPDAEDKAFYDAELRLLARLVALLNDSGQSEPETATVARIEQLRKALFESRDAMRVMSNWAKKPDPAGHSWAVRMVDRANAALNGEPEPRAEVMLFADNDERDEFIRVCQDFDDDGETCVDYELLMKWASNGLLDCDHFTITKKGRAAIDAARTGASS